MDKFQYLQSVFPKLKDTDSVLYMNVLETNISTCEIKKCKICTKNMKNHYAGYIRDGIFHYMEES